MSHRHLKAGLCRIGCWGRSLRQRDGVETPFRSHGIGARAKRPRLPFGITVGGDIVDPDGKPLHGLNAQGPKRVIRRFLLSQPAIEQLLHGPGRLAKLVKPDHAGAALECVEGTAQYRQLADIPGLVVQSRNSGLGLPGNLARFLQEDIPQIVFFKIFLTHWRSNRHGSLHRGGDQICQ